MKYVIEIEDKPLCYYDKESNIYFPRVRKAIGFNTLVFDEEGLKKLEPYKEVDVGEVYQKGLNDAWGAKSFVWDMDDNERINAFGTPSVIEIFGLHAQEVIAKLQAYEEQQKKADDEIKVGDEIKSTLTGNAYLVSKIVDDLYLGFNIELGLHCAMRRREFYKTGRYFPEVAQLLKKMKGK